MAHKGIKIIKSLGRLFNHKISHDEKLTTATFKLPGFQYSDLDRAGMVNLYQLNKVLETSRLLPLSGAVKEFFPIDPTQQTVMVMFAQHFTVLPQYYPKFRLHFPMVFENSIAGMGKSAMVRKITLAEEETGTVFATVLQKLVNMDKETKRSCEITSQMQNVYRNVDLKDAKDVFPDIKPENPPETSFKSVITVRHSDMDFLFHANQASYMRYSMDCASEAAAKGYFSTIKDDICLYHGLEASTLHRSESFAGDEITVQVWEDKSDPFLLHFVITKNSNNTFLFYSNMKFCEGHLC